jgi:hypothetical protein
MELSRTHNLGYEFDQLTYMFFVLISLPNTELIES